MELDFLCETQTESTFSKRSRKTFCIGFLSSPDNFPILVTPKNVKTLITRGFTVYIQRDYGKMLKISNLEYANHGAEITDNNLNIIHLSNIIIKSAPATSEEFEAIEKNKVIFSSLDLETLERKSIFHLIHNKVTAFAINHITDPENKYLIEELCNNSLKLHGTIHYLPEIEKLGNIIISLIEGITLTTPIRLAINVSPFLMRSIYCIEGQICQPGVAEIAHIAWKDILELSWNWN